MMAEPGTEGGGPAGTEAEVAMIVGDRRRTARTVLPQTLAACAQFALLGVLGRYTGLGAAGWSAGAGYAVAVWILFTVALRRAGRESAGPADRVTLARVVLVGGVTALVAQHGGDQGTAITVLATAALVLDGVDGWVARRTGTASALGARFDMEVDAFLILVLSAQVAERLGGWVLLIGLMRYAFVVAGWAMPWLRGELAPSLARKTVAAVQGIVLVVAGAGVVARPVGIGTVVVALALLTGSFGRDVIALRAAAARRAVRGERLESGV